VSITFSINEDWETTYSLCH